MVGPLLVLIGMILFAVIVFRATGTPKRRRLTAFCWEGNSQLALENPLLSR
jgi:hypothetical protein